MRTDHTAATLALLNTGSFEEHWYVEVENGSGTMIDLSDRFRGYSLTLPSPNAPIQAMTLSLLRDVNDSQASSLAPTVASDFNVLDDGVTVSPLIQIGRTVTASIAVTERGASRPVTPQYEVLSGRVSAPSWAGYYADEMNVLCRDESGRFEKEKLEEAHTYAAGTAIEDVMQAVLDNRYGAGVYTLVTPIATGQALSQDYAPDKQNTVWQTLWGLAQSIGFVVWRKYQADGTAALTLFEPDRDKSVSDFTIPAVWEVDAIDINEEEIANVLRGQISDASGVRVDVPVAGPLEDAVSIAKYGDIRRAFWISEPADSPIRTVADMTTLLGKALSDMSEPDMIETVTTPPLFFGECASDLYTFPADGKHYSDAQTLAPFAITCSGRVGELAKARISVRGRPSVGRRTWTRPKGPPVADAPQTTILQNVRWKDSADGLSEVGTWTNGAKIEAVWMSVMTFETPVTDDAWDLVAASVTEMDPALSTTLTVEKPSEADGVGRQTLVQLEGRWQDPASGEWLVDETRGVFRRIIYPKTAIEAIDPDTGLLGLEVVTETNIADDSISTPKLQANSVTAAEMAAIVMEIGKYIESTSYVEGSAGWRIDADGSAQFNNLTITGYPTTSEVEAIAEAEADAAQTAAIAAAPAVIRRASTPTTRGDGTALKAGDIWIDTDDGDAPYTHNGTSFIRMYTKIDGGNIVTGTVSANRVAIGSGSTYGSGYDPSTKETPTGAQTKATTAKNEAIAAAATDATSKANTAESNAESYADTIVTNLETSLGGLAYEDLVEAAKLGSTVISGGFIKTELLDADIILAKVASFGTLSAIVADIGTVYSGLIQNASSNPTAAIRLSSADTMPATATQYIDMAGADGMTFKGVADGIEAPTGGVAKTIRIPALQMMPNSETAAYDVSANGVVLPGNAGSVLQLFGSVVLPPGVTITSVSARVKRATLTDQAQLWIYKLDDSGGTPLTIGNANAAAGGWQTIVDSGLNEVVSASSSYAWKLQLEGDTAAGDAGALWLEIDYTMPDYANSL